MTSAIETALTELSANLRRMEQRHQAVGYKFDRLYDLIDAAREELAGLTSSSHVEEVVMPSNPHNAADEPGEHVAWAMGAGAVLDATIPLLAKLRALSVTNILLDVVPGIDGMGHEVYANSVDEVVEKLSELGGRLEDYQLGIRSTS